MSMPTIRSIAGSAAAGTGPLHVGNYCHRGIDGRSTILNLAATDLIAVILVVNHPVALIELAIETMQSIVIVMPEALPAFFFFAAVVTHFGGASPEAAGAGSAAIAVIARAAKISLGSIADHQQAQTGQQDEHKLTHGHSLIAGGPGAQRTHAAVPPAPFLALRTDYRQSNLD